VYSYPSTGGIILKNVVGVELEFLGLPRIATVQCHDDAKKEDDFALRMLQIGARWWPSLKFYKRHAFSQYPYGYHYPSAIHVGYPSSGGVVLLELFAENSMSRLEEYDPPETPDNWVMVMLCGTMDERCAVLQGFGATLYEAPESCDKLPKTLADGITEGKRYEALMRKMEDDVYLDNWMENL
jgi:hypothetical protein